MFCLFILQQMIICHLILYLFMLHTVAYIIMDTCTDFIQRKSNLTMPIYLKKCYTRYLSKTFARTDFRIAKVFDNGWKYNLLHHYQA